MRSRLQYKADAVAKRIVAEGLVLYEDEFLKPDQARKRRAMGERRELLHLFEAVVTILLFAGLGWLVKGLLDLLLGQ